MVVSPLGNTVRASGAIISAFGAGREFWSFIVRQQESKRLHGSADFAGALSADAMVLNSVLDKN